MEFRRELDEEFFAKGFTHETDPFKKQPLAERLTRILTSLNHGSVSIIDGRWGCGKSTFAKQWVTYLKEKRVPCIYFDAFASDYVESPFQAIASAFVRAAQEARDQDEKAYDSFLSATTKVAKAVAAPAAKMAVKAFTLGVVGSQEVEAVKSAVEELATGFGEMSESAIKEVLEGHYKDEASFESLKRCLSNLPILISNKIIKEFQGELGEEYTSDAMIVIIDELDRCRPDFALGVMEVLKHFFQAKGMHFVLVTNKSYLELSVRKRYGFSEASDEYLQKFYDFIIPFEAGRRDSRGTAASYHAAGMLQGMLGGPQTSMQVEIIEFTSKMIAAYNLSLRQAEKVVSNIILAEIDVNRRDSSTSDLISILTIMKIKDYGLYTNIRNGLLDAAKILQFIDSGNWDDGFPIEYFRQRMMFHSDPSINANSEENRSFGGWMNRFNYRDRMEVLPQMANSVVDKWG